MTEKKICLTLPFSSSDYAELASKVLIVDKEHKRSEIHKKIETEGDILNITFFGSDLKKLRVAVNSTLKNLLLITKTIDMYKAC